MIEAGLHKIIPQLEEIGSSASKEFALELAMGKMKEEWHGVEEIQQMLDDHILKAQTMHSSAYIKPFEAEMTSWEDKLISMQDILDAWLRCQESWLYLEPIFNSEDIMKQMPNEGRKFNKVDRIWRNIMAKTVADPQVLQATSQSNMLVNLQEANDLLDEIMKGVQPHIKKCFEGIESLIFQTDKFGNQDIIGMKSLAEEEVSFTNTIFTADAKGMVEKWLLQLEKQMIMSLKDIINKSISDFYQTPLLKWCLYWPGQVVSVSSMLNWTSDASEAIEKSSLKSFLDKFNNQNLVILNVHARNVIERIYEQNVLSIQDFNWKSQLRYYQGNDSGEVFVEMVTTRIQYGYEYIGNSPRLVMTPLTERCYRTLMGALKMHLGGAPEGPAGSGKTETCKDLAKAVAKQCVIFNCSDGIDYHGMGKFLKGLAQSGAWACFDEFNRIDLDVLSVVAQQIQTIQNAIASNLTTFNFEGAELTLNKSCSIFITMNPSYGTRKAIPDNLKLLFRPVAMMLPDISMIAQVTLYAMGFQNARSLAKKIIDAYKLCSEQLSYQAHYDFGMRAVKSTLTATGKLRLKTPELTDENKLILIGLLEVNMPKFIQDDIFLFKGILKDLFPDELSDDLFNKLIHKGQLIECIKKACLSSRLQPTPEFVDKTFQIYSSMQINHGIMIIGETMSCKTTSYQTLAKALSLLADEFKSEKGALFKIINPKSITMNQLYGLFDPVSREWSDGVLGKTFREMAVSNVPERKWIIFDGPVDSIWIENLNTVLDDSKKLCLMNGEIIHMTPSMNLIFEVGCLQNASPATVGRCGMIYMESRILGWRPIKKSFLGSLMHHTLLEANSQIQAFYLIYSELHLFHSFLRFLRAVLKVSESELGKDGSKTSNDNSIDIIDIQTNFLFAILWGLCSTITKVDRGKFDTFFRNLVDGLIKGHSKPPSFKLARANLIPEQGSIFDYTLDPNKIGSWLKWSTFVDNNGVIRNDSENLIVSTTETVKQSYFLDLAITYEYPLGIIGPSGTGKSFITNSLVQRLSSEKFITNVINFSAQTTVNYTQEVVMSKLDRRRKGVFGPAMGKKCVVFIDDLNLPQADEYGSVPPLELLRQWIDHGYWYEKKDSSKLELLDVLLFAALTPSTGNDLSSRFMRHLNILGIDDFEDETLRRIFSTNISFHFQKKNYELAVANLALPLIEASLSVYKEVLKDFLPTPTKCHYVYNLRDFARVIQGIKMVPNTHLKDPNKLIRLWCHETYRVFYDRLVNDDDRNMFFKIIKHHVQVEFKVDLSKILFPHTLSGASIVADEHLRSLCFGDYMHPEVENKIYDEVPDVSLLTKAMEHYLQEYNASGSRAPMSLVMFRFAVEHISRINRIIKTGHAMLVGIGGTGRQSLAKLATFIARYELFQIEINRTYGLVAWRNDLRKVLKKAGAEGKKVVFLFTDQQIQEESFLEDISMILNTGEVPNLFNSEEKAEILDRVQMNSKSYRSGQDMGGASDASFANLYNLFLQNIKNNLHIVICMSPIGTAFRRRLRMFPSLLNCCTLNWFSEWPQDALVRVATKFLEDMNMEDENVRHSCVVMCGHFHETVRKTSIKFYEEFQRNNYVTPTSYLSLILTFKSLLKGKRDEILNTKTRYEMGLGKLEYASSQVTAMQKELTALRPQLLDTSDDTEKLMIKIEQDTIQVEAKKEIVACDEALANEAAAAAQAIRDDCENDLAEAIPALQSAVNSLDTLNPNDITVVKTMKNPAPIVKFVVEAVCVMKGVLPDRRPDLENKGRLIDDYWSPGQKMMGDIKFLDTLRAYDKDNISPSIMKKIREKYVTNPYFDPNLVKKVSTACEGLCKWVRAIEVYDRVIKIVSPKKAKLAEAETELARQMDKLNDKRAQLQAVTDKLQALNDEFAAMTKKKKDLEDNIRLCSEKLDRAEKLIKGLGGERDRWSSMADSLGFKLKNITGDVLLASGAVAYLGAFNVSFRKSIILDWQNECAAQKIPCSDNFSLINILGEPVQIRQWQIAGLPKDLFSVENGLIVKNSNRWPLMIDPQGQASKWIKNMEKENLCIIKYSDPEYLLSLANAIQSGAPVLLEGVGDNLDPGLESVLMKRTFKNKGSECINVGSQVIEYDPNFHLYIVTSLRNPHFPPEVAIKVTLLNFMITPEGLQDQLLGILAAAEKPELEEMKNKLIVDGAKNKKQLKDIEDKILKVLSTSQGNILEDETAIRILSSSKVLSEEIEAKQEVASKTEKEIDRTRDGYNPVATHASVLFFCVSELSQIDPMYQFSLPWFIQIYVQSINDTPSSKSKSKEKGDTDRRISNLNTNFTEIIYRKISRSLLREHVLVFSFILSLRLSGEDNWQYILKEVRPIQHNQPIPPGNWISEKMWNAIVSINKMESFQGLMASLRDDFEAWKEFYYSASPSRDILPNGWRQIRDLDYIFLLKILRPDRVIFAIRDFVSEKLGRDYVYPQILDLKNCYEDSDSSTPIILILSPGADPLASINSIQVGSDKAPVFVRSLSLGQGQGPKAESLLISASREGGWIILQNCHLSPHWMNDRLEAIWEDEVNIDPDPRFRLWLTSYPTEDFPPQILQLSIKVSLQSPNGLKANLSVAFSSPPISTSDFYDVNECPLLRTVFRRLVYGLSFFHGITLERLNYEGLGWNDVTYEFTWSDLNISLHQLKDMLLSENNCNIVEEDKINFAIEKCIPALQYLIGECNYGGRVREAFDRRLLSSLLKTCFNISLASTHRANISGNYFIPGELQRANILEIIARFSDISDPDAVGLHENAALIRNESDGRKIINWTHLATRYGEFTDMMTWNLSEMDKKIARFMESLPLIFDLSYVYNNFPVQYEDSINTTLRLEITRYNALLILIKDNFERLSLAIKGKIALIPEIEIAYREVNSNNVLSSWRANSYDSLRSLDDYLNNLKKRIEFFIVWIESNNRPDIYWISAFFFPQSLLTSVLQNFARKKEFGIESKEVEGIIIDGIYLEGASWDDANGVLTECLPKIHHSKLPPMLLRPRQVYNEMNKSNLYKCPVYRNEARKGNILATGHSTNYVFDIKLPSNVNNEHWILRGVAGILELRDCDSGQISSFREDGKCGKDYRASNGKPASCLDIPPFPTCCQLNGHCGWDCDHVGVEGSSSLGGSQASLPPPPPQKVVYPPNTNTRSDGRCGPAFPLEDGVTPSECDPNSEYFCCSENNYCGSTQDHCYCETCVNYRPLKVEGKSANPCCSAFGYCGPGDDHCTCDGCIDFRSKSFEDIVPLSEKARPDRRCGNSYPLSDGTPAECDSNSPNPCCSKWGYCGPGSDHCDCPECVDYRPHSQKLRMILLERFARIDAVGQCSRFMGRIYPPNVILTLKFFCCSKWGFCGGDEEHCGCPECVNYKKN
ncbi:DNAH [Lepeophtheirus salmonis]|uniref:DNAH n=1 Tax=Lepeophtheirus salmonis TaxID=72036 RepID=A0A7R8HDK8_LEPSM|nr:DNAH [Lepeophtheirus salmonis]CAF3025402.1 DNAH [Lepeophtheirus salmonis]